MIGNFDKSLPLVLASEGGFSNVTGDRGKATNQGITLKTLKDFYAAFDYGDWDEDGDIDIMDIVMLDTPDKAAPIYRKWFWDRIRGDELPSGVDYLIFDSAVNHGPKNAGIFLQRAANRQGINLTVDGSIGPMTIWAVSEREPQWLIADILRERDIFYKKIIARDPSQSKFERGWMNRLAAVGKNVRSFA